MIEKFLSEFYDVAEIFKQKFNKSQLFVINTSTRDYRSSDYDYLQLTMKRIFPTKTKYELEENIYTENIKEKKEKNLLITLK